MVISHNLYVQRLNIADSTASNNPPTSCTIQLHDRHKTAPSQLASVLILFCHSFVTEHAKQTTKST